MTKATTAVASTSAAAVVTTGLAVIVSSIAGGTADWELIAKFIGQVGVFGMFGGAVAYLMVTRGPNVLDAVADWFREQTAIAQRNELANIMRDGRLTEITSAVNRVSENRTGEQLCTAMSHWADFVMAVAGAYPQTTPAISHLEDMKRALGHPTQREGAV